MNNKTIKISLEEAINLYNTKDFKEIALRAYPEETLTYTPKYGDIIVVSDKSDDGKSVNEYIALYRSDYYGYKNTFIYDHLMLYKKNNKRIACKIIDCNWHMYTSHFRLANDKEKHLFLKELKKIGKVYNEETQEIEFDKSKEITFAKDGDFIFAYVDTEDIAPYIEICIVEKDIEINRWCNLNSYACLRSNNLIDFNYSKIIWYGGCSLTTCYARYATKKEIKLFMDKLHEKGYDWDNINKKIIKI